MNTELQNKAWSILPKEFKEEVKDCYKTVKAQYRENFHLEVKAALIRERIIMLEYLFGHHNLTSDAEGEEMLIISRKEVQEQYQMYRNMGMIKRLDALMRLFGSKCLPDEAKQETKKPSKKPNLSKCDTSWCENEL